MAKRTKITLVLPAYNEENSLVALLERIDFVFQEFDLNGEVLVVNDGSTDRTSEVAKGFAGNYPIEVIDIAHNQGLANAIKAGFLHAALHARRAHDIIIVMDADNTHTPGLILRMVRLIHEGADVVIASRYQKGSVIKGISLYRNILSWGASMLFRILVHIPGVRDYTCGYRAYRASLITTALNEYKDEFINASGFECMVEILLKLKKFNPIITEAPLILRYDLKRDKSKMNVGLTIAETLKLLLKYMFKRSE